MKRFSTWVLAVVLCALVSIATAQPPGGGFGGGRGMFGGGGLSMLGIPEVQKELKLTPEQIEQVKTKGPEIRTAIQEIFQEAGGFQALRDLGEEDRAKLFAKVQDVQTKAVASVLKPEQQKRFHQLELQQAGAQALGRKDVAEALKITDEQKEKLGGIQKEQGEAMRQIFQSVGNPMDMTSDERAAMQKKMQTLQKTLTDKSFAILTVEQSKSWKEMIGEPFKFPARGFGGRGPGGGAPRPGNN